MKVRHATGRLIDLYNPPLTVCLIDLGSENKTTEQVEHGLYHSVTRSSVIDDALTVKNQSSQPPPFKLSD